MAMIGSPLESAQSGVAPSTGDSDETVAARLRSVSETEEGWLRADCWQPRQSQQPRPFAVARQRSRRSPMQGCIAGQMLRRLEYPASRAAGVMAPEDGGKRHGSGAPRPRPPTQRTTAGSQHKQLSRLVTFQGRGVAERDCRPLEAATWSMSDGEFRGVIRSPHIRRRSGGPRLQARFRR